VPTATARAFVDRVSLEIQANHEIWHGVLESKPTQSVCRLRRLRAVAGDLDELLCAVADDARANGALYSVLRDLQIVDRATPGDARPAVDEALLELRRQAAHLIGAEREPHRFLVEWSDPNSAAGLSLLLLAACRLLKVVTEPALDLVGQGVSRRSDQGKTAPAKQAQKSKVYAIGAAFLTVVGRVPPYGKSSSFFKFMRLIDERIGEAVVQEAMTLLQSSQGAAPTGDRGANQSIGQATDSASSSLSKTMATWQLQTPERRHASLRKSRRTNNRT
jgi:hypothetical protein